MIVLVLSAVTGTFFGGMGGFAFFLYPPFSGAQFISRVSDGVADLCLLHLGNRGGDVGLHRRVARRSTSRAVDRHGAALISLAPLIISTTTARRKMRSLTS